MTQLTKTYRIIPNQIKFLTTKELSQYLNLGVHKLVIIKPVVPESKDKNDIIHFSGGIYISPLLITKVQGFKVKYPGESFFFVASLLPHRYPPLVLKAYPLSQLNDLIDLQTLLTKDGTGFLLTTYPYNKQLFEPFMYYQLYASISKITHYSKQLKNQNECSVFLSKPISSRAVQFYFNGIKITPRIDFSYSALSGYIDLKFPCKLTGLLTCFGYETC